MPNPTHESSFHGRHEATPGRWLSHAFIALLPVLACFLGGGTQKLGEGIVVAFLGLYLLARPPHFSLGLAANLVLLTFLLWSLIAFLPASWFFQPDWRATYVNDFGISLPTTLSPQPWISLTCLCSFVAGLSWLYLVCAQQLELREARLQLRLFAGSIVVLAAICILFWLAKTAPPFWHNERNFGPFPNRNQTGNLFGLTAIMILACGQDDLRKGRKRWIVWGAALALMVTAIILNFSRAGIGILVAGSALWLGVFSLRQRSPSRIALVLVIVGLNLLVRRLYPLREGTNQRFRLATLIAAILFALHGLVDVSGHRVATSFAAMFLLGLSLHRPHSFKPSRSVSILFRLIGLILLVVGSSWVVAARGEKLLPGSVGVTNAKQLATIDNRERNFTETIAVTTTGLKWAPLDWELYFSRAVAEAELKQTDNALTDFRRARFLEPISYELPLAEGNIWLSSQPVLAATAWREALRRAGPDRAGVFASMLSKASLRSTEVSRILAELGVSSHDLALPYLARISGAAFNRALAKILENDSDLSSFSETEKLALFAYWSERGDAAELSRATKRHPDWLPYAWLGVAKYDASKNDFRAAYELTQRYGEPVALPRISSSASLQQLESRFRAAPDNYAIGYELYRAQMQSGRIDDALNTARHFSERANSPAYFRYLEAQCWAEKQNWERAWNAWLKFYAAQSSK